MYCRQINEEEVRQRPNATIRYSDRYYPDSYRAGQEHENYYQQQQEQEEQPRHQHVLVAQRRPAQQQQQQQQQVTEQQVYVPQVRARPQVFRSPEEVNIPLHHRRPQNLRPQTYFQ